MNKRNDAFTSIEILVSLFFISVATVSMYGIISAVRLPVVKEEKKLSCEEHFIELAGKVKKDLINDETPESDSKTDLFWKNNDYSENGITVKIEDLSSKININFFPKEIIQNSNLVSQLELKEDYGEVENNILNNGLIYTGKEVDSIISEEVYEKYFSAFGIANINIASKIGLEKIINEMTASSSYAPMLLEKRNNLLRNHQFLQTETEYQFLAGILYDELKSVVSLQPAMNIHFIDEQVLEALLSYRPYNVRDWKNKKEKLLALRENNEITANELYGILEVGNNHPLYYFLGTRTWFWKIEISDEKYIYEEIIYLEPKEKLQSIKNCYTINQKWREKN